MNFEIASSWKKALEQHLNSPSWQRLEAFLEYEYSEYTVYPRKEDLFSALDLCSFEDTKVVILGQDPYHGPEQAHGLSFSVKDGVKAPPSLKNIFKELYSDPGVDRDSTDLTDWAKQGVLLLNSVLTVRDGQPTSHADKGWEEFTDSIITKISDEKEHIVFILWGAYAQKKGQIIDTDKHLVIESPHPSPLSSYRGFFGSKPFSTTNEYLRNCSQSLINW